MSVFTKKEIKVITMSALGVVMEFYDFMIFIFLAPVLGILFFPMQNSINSLLAVFAAFAIGYLARPIGGIVFSHFGDRYGRKKTFYFSIILMAIPSFFIALLPTYFQISFYAPLLLVILRLIQGLAVGGEIPGAITFSFEHVATKNRGKTIAFIFLAMSVATLFSQAVVMLLHLIFNETLFVIWGWRIAFLLGAILGVIGSYLRKRLTETPAFQLMLQQEAHVPLFTLLKKHSLKLLQGLSVLCLGAVGMLLIFIYMPSYILNFKHLFPLTSHQIGMINFFNIIIFSLFLVIFGFLSDNTGRKFFLIIGSLLLILLPFPLFKLILEGQIILVIVALLLLGIAFAMVASCYGSLLAELFPTEIRYTGVSLAYNLAFAALGGTTPLIATSLIKVSNISIAPALFLMAIAILSFIGSLSINRNALN